MPAIDSTPSGRKTADQYVLRFEKDGHRDRLKIQAIQGKRSLNKQILLLIEEGEKATQEQPKGAQQ